MFTVCPKCALTLTVTATDLRTAQGFVRCGQCTNVFNALLTLSDERQPAAAAPFEEAGQERPSSAAPDAGGSPPADESSAPADEGSPLGDEDAIEQTSLEFNPAAADVSEIFIAPEAITDDEVTGTYESIVLGAQEATPAETQEVPGTGRSADEELNEQLESLAARIVAARQNELAQTQTDLRSLIEPLPAPSGEPPAQEAQRHLWIAALSGLAVLLIVQMVNHYRDDLAVSPRWHRPLTALYAAFGIALVPRWDLAAYEVHQLGASAPAQSSGELTVRASVRNDAAQPQPLPLLRVTLLDRFGNRLAARDVAPQGYLGHAPPAGTLLPAGERVDAQMAFVDPGRDAVGFEIDACLPAPSARVHCANDGAAK
jgi:predicted Zn finger-like uncharacterized protein